MEEPICAQCGDPLSTEEIDVLRVVCFECYAEEKRPQQAWDEYCSLVEDYELEVEIGEHYTEDHCEDRQPVAPLTMQQRLDARMDEDTLQEMQVFTPEQLEEHEKQVLEDD